MAWFEQYDPAMMTKSSSLKIKVTVGLLSGLTMAFLSFGLGGNTPTASAAPVENGSKINGTRVNGTRVNGMRVNGMRTNGMRTNGMRTNGMRTNGMRVNGTSVSGATGETRAETAADRPEFDGIILAE